MLFRSAWKDSQDFSKGHAAYGGDAPKPVAMGADLLAFEVVEHVVKRS